MSSHLAILRFKEREKYVSAYGIPAFSGNWTFKLRVSKYACTNSLWIQNCDVYILSKQLFDASMISAPSRLLFVQIKQTLAGDNMKPWCITCIACMGETSGSTCDML